MKILKLLMSTPTDPVEKYELITLCCKITVVMSTISAAAAIARLIIKYLL